MLLQALLDEVLELAKLCVQVAPPVLLVWPGRLRDEDVDVGQQHPAAGHVWMDTTKCWKVRQGLSDNAACRQLAEQALLPCRLPRAVLTPTCCSSLE